VPSDKPIVIVSSDEAPSRVLESVRAGEAVLMRGDFRRIDAIWRYLSHNAEQIAPEPKRGPGRLAACRERAQVIRAALHRVLVEVRDDALIGIANAPELPGLCEWVDDAEALSGRPFLLPFRRLQRIISDMRRAGEGLEISALGARITVLPHVYVPSDQSVVDLFAENAAPDLKDAEVLDMGTGTGVLALVAAKLGARRVVATDLNPKAVENARRNVEILGFQGKVDVREAGDLFAPVAGETFDVIVFNPPWIEGRPLTLYDTAIYDEDHALLRRFTRELPKFLCPNGVCFIILSSATDLLGQLASETGLELRERARIWRVGRLLGTRERVALLEIRRVV